MNIKHFELSNAMSHAPRHESGAYGLTLDVQGWVSMSDLLRALGLNDARIGAKGENVEH